VPASGSQPAGDGAALRALLDDALRYREPRRLIWPHFRPALPLLFALAVLANVCYCAAYLVDLPLQVSSFGSGWRRRRVVPWLAGMLFAAGLASYWIADEIYPYLSAAP